MSEDKRRSRSFKVKQGDEKAYGRYTGESPYQAANKALSELIRKKKKDGETTAGKINFTLIESAVILGNGLNLIPSSGVNSEY